MVSAPSRMAWWCSLTILLGAFLLFQVQPVISKMILPWFGGSPAVWTTCMLFFQLLLLGGYAYAHWMTQGAQPGRQALVHSVLLGIAILLLPIIPALHWKPTGDQNPTIRILLVLAGTVGLPYFLLASTGPLVQAWFTRVCPGRSPYWLYALSNIGSLAALLSFPFVVEPRWTSQQQGVYWSLGFAAFAVVCGGLAMKVWQAGRVIRSQTWDEAVAEQEDRRASTPSISLRLVWVALPALGCVALLATTNHLCQDVAVVPFMWVAPLSLYLLSYILAFAGSWAYPRRTTAFLAGLGLLLVAGMQRHYYVNAWLDANFPNATTRLLELQEKILTVLEPVGGRRILPAIGALSFSFEQLNEAIISHVAIYLITMFAICLLCHGELARLRPASYYLTSFYLMSSAGGALGGVFVALICPVIFRTYQELYWMMAMAAVLAAIVLVGDTITRWRTVEGKWRWAGRLVTPCLILPLLPAGWGAVLGLMPVKGDKEVIATMRSFYGVLRVEEVSQGVPGYHRVQLLNGRILHGFQLFEEPMRRIPSSYYTKGSGAAVAMETLRRVEAPVAPPTDEDLPLNDEAPLRIAVVGLGTGTMAAFGQKGDTFRFYEINPQVVTIAREYFSYLEDTPAQWDIALGDARLSMEREESQSYHGIFLDAFSGDAIPVHLLTRESLEIYLQRLHPRGIIVVHVSNRHIDLIPVVGRLAREFNLAARLVSHHVADDPLECSSDWVLVTRSPEVLADLQLHRWGQELTEEQNAGPLWTDQYSNLLDILK